MKAFWKAVETGIICALAGFMVYGSAQAATLFSFGGKTFMSWSGGKGQLLLGIPGASILAGLKGEGFAFNYTKTATAFTLSTLFIALFVLGAGPRLIAALAGKKRLQGGSSEKQAVGALEVCSAIPLFIGTLGVGFVAVLLPVLASIKKFEIWAKFQNSPYPFWTGIIALALFALGVVEAFIAMRGREDGSAEKASPDAPAAGQTTNPLAVIAFVLALGGTVCFGYLTGFLAVAFGVIAKKQIEKNPDFKGLPLAQSAEVIGGLSVLVWIIMLSLPKP